MDPTVVTIDIYKNVCGSALHASSLTKWKNPAILINVVS